MQTITGNDIEKAREFLMNGELVAIPTETVYGLAANALNEDAVVKIFEAKNRPAFNPLIIHVGSWLAVEKYVQHIPTKAKLLAEKFTPGPLTFLLQKNAIIPDIVTAHACFATVFRFSAGSTQCQSFWLYQSNQRTACAGKFGRKNSLHT